MDGGGGVVAFEVAGGKAAAFRLANALKTIDISNNLGDAKSLLTHPETTTHSKVAPEERAGDGCHPRPDAHFGGPGRCGRPLRGPGPGAEGGVMSEHRIALEWNKGEAAFTYEAYTRNHTIRFKDGQEI